MSLSLLSRTFLASNFLYGAGFAFSFLPGVTNSSLYQSLAGVYGWMPRLWGLMLALAAIATLMSYLSSSMLLGSLGASTGLLAWMYATWVYLLTGFYLVSLTVGILYMMFWVSYYFEHISSPRKSPQESLLRDLHSP